MRIYENYISHHGILGQKWGVRRFQNEDGSLTAKGRKRYDNGSGDSVYIGETKSAKETNKDKNEKQKNKKDLVKKVLTAAGAVAVTAALSYVGYKLYSKSSDRSLKKNFDRIIDNIEKSDARHVKEMHKWNERARKGRSNPPNKIGDDFSRLSEMAEASKRAMDKVNEFDFDKLNKKYLNKLKF